MLRVDLLSALKKASGALASKEDVASFSAFFFDGEKVRAYDDEVSIAVRCALPVTGGLNGKMLLAWLGSCSAENVEVEEVEAGIRVKCGRSRMNLQLLPPKNFQFTRPTERGAFLTAPFELVDRISRIVPFMGNDPSQPWTCGITLSLEALAAELYATNDLSLGCYQVDLEENEAEPTAVRLMPRFVELLNSAGRSEAISALEVGDGWVEATFEDESTLFSKTGSDVAVDRFTDLMADLVKDDTVFINIPAGLSEVVQRTSKVLTVMRGKDETATHMTVKVKAGRISVRAKDSFGLGALADSVRFEGEHEEVEIKVLPEVTLAALENAKEVAVTPGVMILRGNGFTGMVAVVTQDD